MTVDQLAAAIDAYTWLDTQIDTFGPGVVLAAAWWLIGRLTWRTLDRLADAHDRITAARELLADTRPAEDTQPGTDNQLLNTCRTTWNTDTPPRKEK
ncbi:hypothetical protein [Streptomyces olivaceus]|uniref:hypothetical protein n=1 Tax=Streptomyces olivaceus TaxID=47716 RepID=UPI0004CA95E0|nr:hypothetical protein [Streptomyces olivaceus]MBZ6102773.1 hypothetical protein [Streptomyces olivaceus]